MSVKLLTLLILYYAFGNYLDAQQKLSTNGSINLKTFQHIRDINYAGSNNKKQTLDLIIPKDVKKETPIVVFIHGGAWKSGDKKNGLKNLTRIMKAKYGSSLAYATINYRLTDEAIWPAQIHDCKAAIRWIKANAKKYKIDHQRIGVWGPSAGGHLASMLGTSSENKLMNGSIGPYANMSSKVKCVVNFYGPSDFLQMNKFPGKIDHNAPNSPESKLIGSPIQTNKRQTATANPINYISRASSAYLHVHGDQDQLVPYNQSQLLHHALKKANIQSTLITVEQGGHGNGFGPKVFEHVSNFFAHHLLNKEVIWQDFKIKRNE